MTRVIQEADARKVSNVYAYVREDNKVQETTIENVLIFFDAGSNVLEQKIWSCKNGKMQTRSVSGDYGESFSTEYKIIIYVCCMMNYKLRKYYSNLVFLLLSVVRTFSLGVGISSLVIMFGI